MPTKVEKDAVTGQETTGHEWDGIKELNNPLPKWWLYVFYATIVFALVYVVLYPAIPGLSGYTKGLLGWDRRSEVEAEVAAARAAQGQYREAIREAELATVREDPELLAFAMRGGETVFADNCAPCHGSGGAGRPGGYPALVDDAWLWGGSLEEIHHTIRYGVRCEHPQSRQSQMPAFGEILSDEQVRQVADYVLTLSGKDEAADDAPLEAGAEIFAQQCVACHGADGGGNADLGAPALNDRIWLYGGERADLIQQIRAPRHGVMPAWEGRLDAETGKMLAVYVHVLGGGEK
jgi:cytochrome c oxidase cbb3-type subunit 3